MKKRSVLMTVLAMILVAVISVGSTLAYLTATSNDVTNTFTFADMTVTLTEDPPSTLPPDATVSPNDDGGYDYKNLTPNSTLQKNPKVKTTTGVDAYLFVRVKGASDLVKPCDASGVTTSNPIEALNWKPVPDPDSNFNGIYYREVPGILDAKGVAQPSPYYDVFQYVKIADQNIENAAGSTGTTVTLAPITIDVFEIQKQGVEESDAITAAQDFFTNKDSGSAGAGAGA